MKTKDHLKSWHPHTIINSSWSTTPRRRATAGWGAPSSDSPSRSGSIHSHAEIHSAKSYFTSLLSVSNCLGVPLGNIYSSATDLPPSLDKWHSPFSPSLKGNFPLFWSISLMTFLGVDFLASWDIKSWIKLSMLHSLLCRCGTSTSGTATWSWSARPPSPPSTGRATRSPSRKVKLCHGYCCLKQLSSCH